MSIAHGKVTNRSGQDGGDDLHLLSPWRGYGVGGWLHDNLTQDGTFSREQVFRDVDGIAPGDDFVAVLEAQVAACDVLLCVIGRGWLSALDRLAQDNDYVRIELAAALASGKKVIPLLIDQAQMPATDRLPEELRALTRR